MAAVEREHSVGPKGAFLGFAALAAALLGVAGRLLAYPLNRDENMFVSVASQIGSGDLYRDLGYNHLPNLAYLLAGVFAITDTQHYLLVGRLVMVAGWIGAIAALWLIVRRLRLGLEVFFAASALILGNVLLLGPSGMLVSNNFLPIPFIFFAFYFLLGALAKDKPGSGEAFLAGLIVSLTIGLKANYIVLAPLFALAALLAPAHRPLRERIIRAFVPLAIGGVVGGLPSLLHLTLDPQGFLSHTLRYFTELQPAFWQDSTEPKTVSMTAKVLLAEQIWLRDMVLLAIASSAILGIVALLDKGVRSLVDWRVILLCGLVLFGFVVAFVPTPSFPQYFAPPVPFIVLLVIVLASIVRDTRSAVLMPLMVTIAALGLLAGATRIVPGLMEFRKPDTWQAFALKREVSRAGDIVGLPQGARVATLTPVYALEGGYSVYPEFVAGQFMYRVSQYISEADRPLYRTTSPFELEAFLDADPPAGILVNRGEPMERALADYAKRRGYSVQRNSEVGEGFDLYVAPQ